MIPMQQFEAAPITFEQRLQLVLVEVKARVQAYPAKQQNAKRATLWVRWINRNILADAPQGGEA